MYNHYIYIHHSSPFCIRYQLRWAQLKLASSHRRSFRVESSQRISNFSNVQTVTVVSDIIAANHLVSDVIAANHLKTSNVCVSFTSNLTWLAIENNAIYSCFTHQRKWFSKVMFAYQRVRKKKKTQPVFYEAWGASWKISKEIKTQLSWCI